MVTDGGAAASGAMRTKSASNLMTAVESLDGCIGGRFNAPAHDNATMREPSGLHGYCDIGEAKR